MLPEFCTFIERRSFKILRIMLTGNRSEQSRGIEEFMMPLVYRAMRWEKDGPMVGHEHSDTLGVREVDVQLVDGLVHPGTGGMSVSPSKRELPPHLIPKRLRNQGYPEARRSNAKSDTFPCRTGNGEFADGPFCQGLQLRIDRNDLTHGLVEPDRPVTLAEHRVAIEATRSNWDREDW
jgi:hypothetical protein